MLKRILSMLVGLTLIGSTAFAAGSIELPSPKIGKGMSVTTALEGRRSTREFSSKSLTTQQLSKIFWAANGINRPETGGRVNPAAHGQYIIDVYAIMDDGIYCYDPKDHRLILIAAGDYRELASTQQGFAQKAPLNLVYVMNTESMKGAPHGSEALKLFVGVAAGTMAQSVALVLEAEGLGGCIRGSIDAENFRSTASLKDNQEIILAQTVGAIK